MSNSKESSALIVTIMGFVLLVVGMGLDGGLSLLVIGAGVVTFIVAIVMSVAGGERES